MIYPNLISTSIPDKDLDEILGAIAFISEKLSNLITISELEKSTLYKANCDTIKFVVHNLKMANQNPELVPDDVDIDEIRKDVELIKSIEKIQKPIYELLKKMDDSKLVAGSEAYLPSMAIYNAIKARDVMSKHIKSPSA